MIIIPVSYPLTTGSPLYPGTPPITIVPDKSIDRGNTANTSSISFSSHAGTHIDAPLHFCQDGRSILSVLQKISIFFPAYCIDVPVTGDTGVMAADLKDKITEITDAEAILIRTGTWRIRATDPETYSAMHPWIPADTAAFLRKNCPRLRLLGVDTISIATPTHRLEGQESHKAFLCGAAPICLLEDADFSAATPDVAYTLTVFPWIHEELDGVPVSAFITPHLRKTNR